MIEKILKDNNIKITSQRKVILETIINLKDEATIHNILTKNPDMTKSTIYRIIDTFLENNIIDKEFNVNNEVYYSICSEHNHYLTCIKCHKRLKINVCPIENKDLDGFIVTNHKIELSGICKNCQQIGG